MFSSAGVEGKNVLVVARGGAPEEGVAWFTELRGLPAASVTAVDATPTALSALPAGGVDYVVGVCQDEEDVKSFVCVAGAGLCVGATSAPV